MYNSRGVAVDSRARFALVFAFALFLLATLSSGAQARPASPAPPLPAPTGTIVNVSTAAQLQAAVQNLASNTTVVLAPGTYTLTSTLWINGSYSNVAIRGSSNDPNATVIVGPGMTNASYGNVPYGIWTGGNVQGVLIANLTLRNFYYHAIIFNGVTQSPHVYNVHLLDTGEQLIKSNPDGAGGGVNNGIVEYSTIEYTTTSKDYYTNGVDVYTGSNWIIRHNLFRNIVAPAGQLAGPAVLAWAHSANTIAEGNTFINCARGISFGLQDVSGFDHSGGIIRNNIVLPREQPAGRRRDRGVRLAEHARREQYGVRLGHLRDADRVPLREHDGRRDQEQPARRHRVRPRRRDRHRGGQPGGQRRHVRQRGRRRPAPVALGDERHRRGPDARQRHRRLGRPGPAGRRRLRRRRG